MCNEATWYSNTEMQVGASLIILIIIMMIIKEEVLLNAVTNVPVPF